MDIDGMSDISGISDNPYPMHLGKSMSNTLENRNSLEPVKTIEPEMNLTLKKSTTLNIPKGLTISVDNLE